jgi:hypothetical protein
MLDECDYLIGPCDCVVDGWVIAVNHQKFDHSDKGSSFIALLECMRLGETSQQPHREHDNVIFTISECVLRTLHRSVQQSWISQEMPLPGHRDDRAMTTSIGSHLGSFGKGRQNLGKTRDYLAGQRLVVDIALQRPRPQDLASTTAPLRGQCK